MTVRCLCGEITQIGWERGYKLLNVDKNGRFRLPLMIWILLREMSPTEFERFRNTPNKAQIILRYIHYIMDGPHSFTWESKETIGLLVSWAHGMLSAIRLRKYRLENGPRPDSTSVKWLPYNQMVWSHDILMLAPRRGGVAMGSERAPYFGDGRTPLRYFCFVLYACRILAWVGIGWFYGSYWSGSFPILICFLFNIFEFSVRAVIFKLD